MQLFRVLEVPGEKPRTVTEGGYVDAAGHLAGIPATGEAPATHARHDRRTGMMRYEPARTHPLRQRGSRPGTIAA